MYKWFFRPIFFALPPETAHNFVISLLRISLAIPGVRWIIGKLYRLNPPCLARNYFGLPFPGVIGLPAGFDKQAILTDRVAYLGFSFMEVGTVVPKPQAGNEKPRIFRLKKDRALINRMGFNSPGLEAVCRRLAKKKSLKIPVAGNIGKNTLTPNAEATADYLRCFCELYPLVDFFVVNVSCPNVQDLCGLQQKESLRELLFALTNERKAQRLYRPILLKLGPDQDDAATAETVRLAIELGIDGFVVSNTTTSRQDLLTPGATLENIGQGGLSGAPLFHRSLHLIRVVREAAGQTVPIIGVGGISTGEQALQMLQAGASLLQIYTGWIYHGPCVIRKINRYLCERQREIPKW